MKKRLYKSRTQRSVFGVCGGLAEYFNIDVVLVRLIFVIFTFLGGPGLIVYIALALIMSEEPREFYSEKSKNDFA